ncbi:hypothetical protein BB560_002598 [Smittium megazygosporum]|uniref:Mob1/phocein n=1 Tax=Smittium megazygosporum TaxID=133381 RepID=A0A2T9ZED0_9FUNG|nr:hypothetical protein BB560_002598 [Smittium megazygosporum]
MSASEYITQLMYWVNQQLDDEEFFPSSQESLFRQDFSTVIAPTIFRRLLRVYSHIYHHHVQNLIDYGLISMLNSSFHHFVLFATRYGLIDSKEFAPVRDVIRNLS